ncbi:MAG: hypothetical protein IPI04_06420 [Ignavibacteria bacterium]|nr:hypothetical protein [Ignavibacteria bacterium]
MKKKIQSLFLAILFAVTLAFSSADAQVTVAGSAGAANGSYATLKAAFDALNLETTQAGNNITITINAGTYLPNSETAPCVLNQPTTSSWTSLTITPIGAVTVSGAIAAGSPLIDLNGADNVTIDGLNASGNSMIIENTTVSATTGTSTIRLQTDATGNTITRCSVLGASTMAVGTNGGNIYFGANAVTGSDNNTVSNCNIGPSGANLPTKGVYANGTATATTNYNNNNTITGCNIYDFFGAAVQSAGIYITGGNTDYTITNNKVYQTAARTQTTGSIHAGIQLASANINNCTITGNTVGYASNTGTGTYTFAGVSSSSRFYPIYQSAHGTLTASSYQGNTVTAISLSGLLSGTSTSSPFAGILVTSGLAVIGNVTGNTVGSTSVSGSISYTSSGTSTGELYGIYYFPSAVCNVSNNIVGGITGTNTSTGGLLIYGIRAFTSSTVINTMVNNTVGYSAAPLTNNAATSTASRVIGLYAQSGASVVTGNTITNLFCVAPNVGTGSASSVIGLWSDNSSATLGNDVSRNIIHTLSNTNATAAVWVTGMSYNGSTTGTHKVSRNFIHSLNMTSSSATATMNGIYIIGGLTTYQNNMVRLGVDATGTDVTAGVAINGISEQVAGTDNIYFNSVYIGGSNVGGSANSYAFVSTITTNTRNFRDNIFFNARSNGAGTGKHYAVRVGGTAPNPAGLTINNNVYFANGTGAVFGFFNSLDVANLAAWQAAVGLDANSFYGNPQYQTPNGTSATVDLHINPSINTPAEGNGFDVVSITDDYDGQTRSGLSPVDIGADAGNFTGTDLAGPVITISPLLTNTSSTGDRAITGAQITITDVSGVPTSGTLQPRIYYKKNAGAYFSAQGSLNGGSGTNGTWSFTILAADMGGLTGGDVVSYFVIAQDVLGNIGANPSAGLVATNVNTVTTPPTTPHSYIIVGAPLSGDYTIGVAMLNRALGKNITMERVVKKVMKEVFVADESTDNVKSTDAPVSTSLSSSKGKMVMKEVEEISFVPMENGREYTGPLYSKRSENPGLPVDAGVGVYGTVTAAVNDLNLRGISGAVRFLLLDATYPSETYPIVINNIVGASATNTFTLKPNTGVTSSISGASASTAAIKVLSSYATIDGSNTVNGTTRDLTIENTSVTSPIAVWFGSTGTTTMNASGIKNCNVINGVNTSSAIVLTDGALTTAGGYFTNFTIQNNNIQKAYMGIYSFYATAAGNGNGCVYSGNSINTSGANSVRYIGIYVQAADGILVTNNDIGNFDGTSAEDDKGIWFASGNINGTARGNYIHDLAYTGTGGYGGHGIAVSTTITGANMTLANNMITNMSGDGWNYTSIPTDNPIGINIFGSIGQSGINVYHNSINLYGNTLNQTSAMSMGIYLASLSNADIRNNSIVNNQGLLGATGYGTVGVYAVTSNAQFTVINNNNYYVSPTGSGLAYIGQIAAAGSLNLGAWQIATAQDANSVSGNPQYVSNADLHVSLATNSVLNNNGGTGTGITTDFDGQSRSLTVPDIGADEFQGTYVVNLTIALEACPSNNITVALYNSSCGLIASQTIAYTGPGAYTVAIPYTTISNATTCWIKVTNENSLVIWSSALSTFTASAISYNFTTGLSQVFGNTNLINVGGVWSMISGDVNQDDAVDGTDLADIDNDAISGVPGSISGNPTDLNCDGFVDSSDLSYADNNATVGYFGAGPCSPAGFPHSTNTNDSKVNSSK